MTAKIAIVTGGGSGIGRSIATALAGAGYRVALFGRRLDKLKASATTIDPSGEAVMAISVDVGDPDAVARGFEAVVQAWGRLDLLVNNAGIFTPSVPLEDVTPAAWSQSVAANLSGAFFCTQAAFRQFKAQSPRGGRIINNGSIAATTPRPQSAPYAATKHAITGLTKAASLDGRAFDIAVGQIDIGNAASDMTEAMSTGVLQADGSIKPEPTIDVEHIAKAVLYMAGLPLDANVLTMTVMANRMPFVGRG